VIQSVWLRGNHLKCLNTKVPWSLTALLPTPAVRRPVKAQSLGKQAAAPDVLPFMMVKPRPIHRILKCYFLTCFYHQNAGLTWLYHPNLGPPNRPKTKPRCLKSMGGYLRKGRDYSARTTPKKVIFNDNIRWAKYWVSPNVFRYSSERGWSWTLSCIEVL